MSGRSGEIIDKYKKFKSKSKNECKKLVTSSTPRRYGTCTTVLSRIIGINERVRRIYEAEGEIRSTDLWDDINHDRNLFGKDGLHWNTVGTACLDRL